MKGGASQTLARWTVAAYASIAVALALVVGLGVWESYRDFRLVRTTVVRAEVARLHSHAVRMVGRIEQILEHQEEEHDLSQLSNTWLRRYHEGVVTPKDQEIYAAVVDSVGRVVMHTDPALIGRRLERRWYERVVRDVDDSVVETRSAALTGGIPSLDLRIPIIVADREVGEYHTGFDVEWLDDWVASHRAEILRRRGMMIGAILAVVLLAASSLYYIALRKAALRRAVGLAQLQGAVELRRVASGLAHEIRNPLHAIRLNLHALQRAEGNGLQLSRDEIMSILSSSNNEIDRVDGLVRDIVHFASPDPPQQERIDVRDVAEATINFVSEEFRRRRIDVRTDFTDRPAVVEVDATRLREIVLQLLENAMDAVEEHGRIEVAIAARNGSVELSVTDNGPGVPENDREHVFDPFYSTKSNGTGLGLAVVKRFARDSGGVVLCEAGEPAGARFRVLLPLAGNTKRKGNSV